MASLSAAPVADSRSPCHCGFNPPWRIFLKGKMVCRKSGFQIRYTEVQILVFPIMSLGTVFQSDSPSVKWGHRRWLRRLVCVSRATQSTAEWWAAASPKGIPERRMADLCSLLGGDQEAAALSSCSRSVNKTMTHLSRMFSMSCTGHESCLPPVLWPP